MSGRQRRNEIKQHRASKKARAENLLLRKQRAERERFLRGKVLVNSSLLSPTNSYSIPDYVERGYYEDRPFRCRDCGKEEVWTATQQKWWYEIAKGDVFATAIRCRPCRRRERERKATARQVSSEGLARKRQKIHN